MGSFTFQKTCIEGLFLVDPFMAADHRGYLSKPYERSVFAEHGIYLTPWEELRTCSHKGVLRGLHFQRNHSQDKLVQVLAGAGYDVAVDLRIGSPTFGCWEGVHLSAENHKMFYIPKGFAHGFLALKDNTLLSYLCGDRYDPESDGGVRWDDSQLAIDWPLEEIGRPVLSEKDATLPMLEQFVEKYGGLAGGGDLLCGY